MQGASAAAVVSTRFLGVLAAGAVALPRSAEARATPSRPPRPGLRSRPPRSCFMAVPIYLNQIGVKLASPLTVRVLLALGPVFLIALQTAVGGMKLSGYSLAGVDRLLRDRDLAALARVVSARAASAPAPA